MKIKLILKKLIELFEDLALARKARKRLKEMDPKDNISFDEATKLAGWKDRARTRARARSRK
ncbi:MAG: hypothetical protein K1000chlam2_01297 [Chlamydiae bacterium]|nr:hypothetical protein [Chlamydiota bacterium]